MKTISLNLYTFQELSPEAQTAAIENYRNENDDLGTFWQNENFQSIKSVLDFFGWSVFDWSIDYSSAARSYIHANFTGDENIADLCGVRLWKYLQNNFVGKKTGSFDSIFDGQPDEGRCLFTGYCADHSIIDPVVKFLARPDKYTTFQDLMNYCIEAGLQYIESDYDSQMSDDYIRETLSDDDENKFTSDGEIY